MTSIRLIRAILLQQKDVVHDQERIAFGHLKQGVSRNTIEDYEQEYKEDQQLS